MILAQTLLSVRTDGEHRAERILGEIDRLLEQAPGQRGHDVNTGQDLSHDGLLLLAYANGLARPPKKLA